MKNIFFVTFFLVTFCTIGCTKGGDIMGISGSQYAISAAATSQQLLPSIDTTSTGTVTGLYDEQTNILTYTVAWSDFFRDSIYSPALKKNVVAPKDTLSAIKFYGSASVTSNGSLARTIAVVNTNKAGSLVLSLSGSVCFTPSEKADFLANNWYILLCTNKFPNGLVRGKLNAVKK